MGVYACVTAVFYLYILCIRICVLVQVDVTFLVYKFTLTGDVECTVCSLIYVVALTCEVCYIDVAV